VLGGIGAFWSWQVPVGAAIVAALIVSGFLQTAMSPTILSLPVLLPEIGPMYAGSAGGIIATLQVLGAVVVPTFVITRLAGTNLTMLFGLAAVCLALTSIPILFLPELGSKALATRAARIPVTALHETISE